MDDKKKILLGEKDILAKENEDIFINVNLNSTFVEIRNEKYENIFDVEKQFKKERNESRNFMIYGTVDSTVADCNNLTLYAYTGLTSGVASGFVKSFQTSPMVYNSYNVFGHKRGKFILSLTGYNSDFVFIKIPSNGLSFIDQFYSQQLIFKDADGNFVEYGTETVEVSENGEAIEISNDFYFLYDKHWIKKDLLITEEKPATISFSANPTSILVTESNVPNGKIVITLDKPSPFGLEEVTLSKKSGTLDSSTGEVTLIDSQNISQPLPVTINFSPGEQIKEYSFSSSIDNSQEFNEDIIFQLDNFQNVFSGSPLEFKIEVVDATPKAKVKLNFQKVFQNRNYFTGYVEETPTPTSNPMSAVLRNGLKFDGTPMEFYPSDNFTLKIKNIGNNTILPINPVLGILSEQLFTNNQEFSFTIQPQYANVQKHSIKFYFQTYDLTPQTWLSAHSASQQGIIINGVPIIDYDKTFKVDYEKFSTALINTTSTTWYGQNLSGWKKFDLERPFDVSLDSVNKTVTITAKSPGTRLDVKTYGSFPNIFDLSNNQLQTSYYLMSAITEQAFVYSAQTPVEIELRANNSGNNIANYQFTIEKHGYDKMTFTPTTSLVAAVNPFIYYLVSGYRDVLRNWNTITNSVVYNHKGVASQWKLANTFGFYSSGDAYVNGVLLLANKFFDRTANIYPYMLGPSRLNKTYFGNATATFFADFLPTPIAVIQETKSIFSVQSSSQLGYLGMKEAYGNPPLPANVNPHRSFDFRTGTTGVYNTYYTNNFQISTAAGYWWSYNSIMSSGGTSTTNYTVSPGLPLRDYLELGNTSFGIPSKGLTGTTPITNVEAGPLDSFSPAMPFPQQWIKLESKIGVPYEFTNIRDMIYETGPNSGKTYNQYPTISYVKVIPAQTAGITVNEANNHMGGYSLTIPSTAGLAPVRNVTFEQINYDIYPLTSQSVKISLNSPSVLGNESVSIIIGSGTGVTASASDYIATPSLPLNINWAIGEQDKYLVVFNAQNPVDPTSNLFLEIQNLTNVNAGSNINTKIELK